MDMELGDKSKVLPFFSFFSRFLIYLNLFFLQSYLIRFSFGSYATNLQEILIGLMALIFLIYLSVAKKLFSTVKNLKNYPLILGLFFLFLISILTVSWINEVDFLRHLKFLFFSSILVFVTLEMFKTSAERRRMLKYSGWGALTFGLFSLIWNLAGFNLTYDYRLTGPLDSAVYLAYYLTPFFIFFVIDWIQHKERQNLFYALILLTLIVLTRSMGAIAASFFILSFFILKKSQQKYLENRNFQIGLGFLGILIFSLLFYFKILPALQTDSSSLGERFQIWVTAFELLKDPFHFFFGIGFGQFQAYYEANVFQVLGHEPLDYYILQPHNIFLLFWLNFGLPGIILLNYIIWRMGRKILYDSQPPSVSQTAAFIFAYFLIHGMIDTPFFKNDLLILFIFLVEMSLWKEQKVYHKLKENNI